MNRAALRFSALWLAAIFFSLPIASQAPAAQAQSTLQAAEPATVPTLQTFTRMVTLELVVKDGKGHHIKGLSAGDFQVFEQTPSRGRERRQEKIASFREVNIGSLAPQDLAATQSQPGVYSNTVTLQKDPVPPTIILVDGLNTELQYQAQIHVQMMRMLRALPKNVPVAVFLFGNGVTMLQNFTTDPELLQKALQGAYSAASVGMTPHFPGNVSGGLNGLSPSVHGDPSFQMMLELVNEFDREMYAATNDDRVYRTVNAISSIARHVSGYPGRKNLLWLSTSFPISLYPVDGFTNHTIDDSAGNRNYWAQLERLNGVLSDAKVAVYPINVAGVQTSDVYKADLTRTNITTTGMEDAVSQQNVYLAAAQDTMQAIADGTGGKICTGNNDLGDCVHKAMDDSSDFYELTYYPSANDWNGEYRKILVKTERSGAHLAYRQGYFATPQGSDDAKTQSTELQADCNDFLDATAVSFHAKRLQAASPQELKFSVFVDASSLTFAPTNDGGHNLDVTVGVCTYNEKGWPMKLMNYPTRRSLTAAQYDLLLSTGSVSEIITVPGPKPAAVRLLVKDVASRRLGSIYINSADSR